MFFFLINPAIPHDFVSKKSIFRYSQWIYDSTPAIIFFTTAMRLCIRENNFSTTGTNPPSGTRSFTPIIIPSPDQFYSKHILITIIDTCILSSIQRPCSFFMKRITVFIPILTQTFITTIFGSKHRMMFTLIYIKHFTSPFSFTNIQHLTGAYRSSSIRIVHIPDSNHFKHVFTTYRLITRFIEQYTRIILKVDDSITH